MSEITDELRAIYPEFHRLNQWDVRYRAADEIHKLRARITELEKLNKTLDKRIVELEERRRGLIHVVSVHDARITELEAENAKLRETNKGLSLKFTNLQHKIGKAVAVLGENDE